MSRYRVNQIGNGLDFAFDYLHLPPGRELHPFLLYLVIEEREWERTYMYSSMELCSGIKRIRLEICRSAQIVRCSLSIRHPLLISLNRSVKPSDVNVQDDQGLP